MLFKKTIIVYSVNRTMPINTFYGQTNQKVGIVIIIAGGTYIYHWALKV